MNLALIWFTCFFWFGLLSSFLSLFHILLGFSLFYLSLCTFELRGQWPIRLSLLAFLVGSLLAPTSPSTLLAYRPWQKAQAQVRLLQVQPAHAGINAWCEILKAYDQQQEPLSHLIGQKVSLTLPIDKKTKFKTLESPENFNALDWQVSGLMKVSATGKVKFKKTDLEPLKDASWLSSLRLTGLKASLSWREYIQALSQKSRNPQDLATFQSHDAMGKSLIHSMLGASRASARVDYILQRLGLSHLTAISGLHFALVGLLAAGLLRRFYVPWRVMGVAILSFLFLIVSSPSPSSLRAWIMSLIAIVCLLTGRQYQALHALALTTLFWLLIYPEWAFQIGFVLSVYCTAILIALSPLFSRIDPANSFLEKRIKPWLAIQGAIFLFTAPLLLYWFHTLSWLSIAANLLLAPVFAMAFAAALACVALSFVWFSLASYLFHLVCAYTDGLLTLLSNLPHRLDQPWQLELSQTSLICLMPWLICCWIKLGLLPSLNSDKNQTHALKKEKKEN